MEQSHFWEASSELCARRYTLHNLPGTPRLGSGCGILDEMRKGITVEKARWAVLDTWQAGILPRGYLMIGIFGEKRETVAETVQFCKETSLISQFSYATLFPGTEIYAEAARRGIVSEDTAEQLLEGWGEWTDQVAVHLSNIPNDELRDIKREAQRQIMWSKPWARLRRYVAVLGMRNMLRETFRYIMRVSRIGRYT